MTAIQVGDGLSFDQRILYGMGKRAADDKPSYALSGMLYHKHGTMGDWIMLGVPNALVRGTFDAMTEPGIELPPSGPLGKLSAHVTVMRPDEVASLGGPDRITERGKHFAYRLGGLTSYEPDGWPEMARCWVFRVHSPELQELRRSYGLSSLPGDGKYNFHVSVAVRRKGVLGRNEKAKSD